MLKKSIQPNFSHYVIDFDPFLPVIWEEKSFRLFNFTEIIEMLLSPTWEQQLWRIVYRIEKFESSERLEYLFQSNIKNWNEKRESFISLYVSVLPDIFDPIMDLQFHKWLTDKVAILTPRSCYHSNLPRNFFL